MQVPEIQLTSEYIRPLSSFARQRTEVTPPQYQEFVESRTPPSQMGSDKILLDSEDEDLR